MASANKINLSLGTTNLPSPNLEINQKNRESVAPTDKRNPLLASSVTEVNGMKKKRLKNKVNKRVKNDNLVKKATFFDSMIFYNLNN